LFLYAQFITVSQRNNRSIFDAKVDLDKIQCV